MGWCYLTSDALVGFRKLALGLTAGGIGRLGALSSAWDGLGGLTFVGILEGGRARVGSLLGLAPLLFDASQDVGKGICYNAGPGGIGLAGETVG